MKKLLIGLILLIPYFASAQSLNKTLESQDISTALKMMGLEVFKFNFESVKDGYTLIVYIDEFENDSIIKHKKHQFGSWKPDAKVKELKLFSKISSATAETYWLNIVHPNRECTDRFDIASRFRKAHYWMPIKQGEIVYEQKTPLLFYGMAWEYELNGRLVRRFCWGEEVDRDMKNKTLNMLEHKIVISYKLVK